MYACVLYLKNINARLELRKLIYIYPKIYFVIMYSSFSLWSYKPAKKILIQRLALSRKRVMRRTSAFLGHKWPSSVGTCRQCRMPRVSLKWYSPIEWRDRHRSRGSLKSHNKNADCVYNGRRYRFSFDYCREYCGRKGFKLNSIMFVTYLIFRWLVIYIQKDI